MVTVPEIPLLRAHSVTPMQDFAGRQQQRLGTALSQIGNEAIRLAEQEQQRIDRARAKRADVTASKSHIDAWTALQQLQGPEALAAAKEFMAGFEQRNREFASGLDNDQQVEAFELAQLNLNEQMHARVAGFLTQTIDEMDKTDSLARVEGGIQEGIALYDPDEDDWKRKAKVILEARSYAQKQGLDPDGYVLLKLTELHSGIIEQQLADGKLDEARSYLTANRGEEIEKRTATALQVKIQAAIRRRERDLAAAATADAEVVIDQQALDFVLSHHGKPLREQLEEATKAAREGMDPRIHRKVLQQFKAADQTEKRLRREENDAFVDSLARQWGDALESGELSYEESPEDVIDALPDATRTRIESDNLYGEVRDLWRELQGQTYADLLRRGVPLVEVLRSANSLQALEIALQKIEDEIEPGTEKHPLSPEQLAENARLKEAAKPLETTIKLLRDNVSKYGRILLDSADVLAPPSDQGKNPEDEAVNLMESLYGTPPKKKGG